MVVNQPKPQPKPVFCPGCRTRDTFERKPKGDVRSAEDNRTLWEAWVCKVCGYKAVNQKEVVSNGSKNYRL